MILTSISCIYLWLYPFRIFFSVNSKHNQSEYSVFVEEINDTCHKSDDDQIWHRLEEKVKWKSISMQSRKTRVTRSLVAKTSIASDYL